MEQPNLDSYGLEALFLCPRLTRAIYLKMFGEDAPGYDPARRIKRWVLPVPPEVAGAETSIRVVTVWDPEKQAIGSMTMTYAEAAACNLPGATSYPKFAPVATSPARLIGPNSVQEISGLMLVDPEEASAIAGEIHKDLGMEITIAKVSDPWPWKMQWNGETRRALSLVSATGQSWDAAGLLKQRCTAGVGAPGKWVQAAMGPAFVPDVQQTGDMDFRPEIPMAVRPKLANERIEAGPFGVKIVRTDREVVAPVAGGLTIAQAEMLLHIGTVVDEIKKAVKP